MRSDDRFLVGFNVVEVTLTWVELTVVRTPRPHVQEPIVGGKRNFEADLSPVSESDLIQRFQPHGMELGHI